ncbi:MAG: NADH:flavin oxidoreductase/NADH oxidase [Bdellovibrionota bacterium]
MLFDPISLSELRFKNRIFVSPMCQYSARNGVPGDWHLVHLGSRAVGGAALVLTEATAVSAVGRISPGDTGLWNDEQEKAFSRIAAFVKEQGAFVGIQLAHAGRKASTHVPWNKGGVPLKQFEGAWTTDAPSEIAFGDYPAPRSLSVGDIAEIVKQFAESAERSVRAGFDVVELHFAHGYLVHEFLSPLSNLRNDSYGGCLENRMRLALEITRAVRAVWPREKALFARISATDWTEGGWDLPQSIQLARALKAEGVDLIDCSSGGNVPKAPIPGGPLYQVPFAEAIRREAAIPTGAVGLITDAAQADSLLKEGRADAIFLARALLRDPYWPLRAAHELGISVEWPKQYERAKFR